MNWDEYRKLDRMNVSTLVHGLKSMLHLKNAMESDDRQTPAMKLGSMIHCLVLEPEEFDRRYVQVPEFHLDEDNVAGRGKSQKRSTNKNTTYVKDKVSEFSHQNAGKTFIDADELERAKRSADSVRSKRAAQMWIEHCEKEVPLTAEIEQVDSKGAIDLLGSQAFLDLKTTQSVEPKEFWYQFNKLRYAFKLAWYRELIEKATGKQLDCYVIAVETTGDFDSAVIPVPDELLDMNFREVRRVLGEYKLCRETGSWPGVDGGEDYLPLAVPEYAMEEEVNWESIGSAVNG